MKKYLILLSACLLGIFVTSCKFIRYNGENEVLVEEDNGETSVRDYTVEAFSDLEISIPSEVKYTTGKASLSIACTDTQADNLKVEQNGDQLTISYKNKKNFIGISGKKMTIYISSDKLNKLTTNGAIDFEADYGIKADDFRASFNGASETDIEGLEANDVNITLNGAGDLTIEGLNCRHISLSGNGAADCEISGEAQSGNMSVNGAGTIDIRKLKIDNLSSSVNGAGKIMRN